MDKPDVFMPLFIGDYLAGTSRLTTELHGAYMLLIMDYWMNGPLPDDDQVLASITKMTPDAWSIARASLKHYFSIADGCWKHKRVEQELEAAYEKKRAAKEKAERAAAARWAKQGGKQQDSDKTSSSNASRNATSNAQAMHEECPSPSPSPISHYRERESAANAPPPPDEKPEARGKRKRGTRLPDDWTLTDEHYLAAQEVRPDLVPHLETVAGAFRDYWHAKTGKDATKLDWLATWRNWLRNEKPRGNPNATSQSNPRKSLAERSWEESEAILADIEARETRERAMAADATAVREQVGEPSGPGET